jgi:ribosomal protein S18 acetylase RimI-like enzyme
MIRQRPCHRQVNRQAPESSDESDKLKMNNYKIREMKISDYKQVSALWQRTEGMGWSISDTKSHLNKYLKRNKGMCFVAFDGKNSIIGTIQSGHDGKRGYIYHLAVDKKHRKLGIGEALVNRSLSKIKKTGIPKCTLFIFSDNIEGKKFWKNLGWFTRTDLTFMQYEFKAT